MPKLRFRRFFRNEDGSVIVETALMVTILLLLTFGIVDMGRSLYIANTLILSARDGARTAAVHLNDGTLASDTRTLVLSRFNAYRFGGPALLTDSVTVTLLPNSTSPTSVQVKIAYPFNWITPVPRLLKWTNSSTYTSVLHSQAEYKFEQP